MKNPNRIYSFMNIHTRDWKMSATLRNGLIATMFLAVSTVSMAAVPEALSRDVVENYSEIVSATYEDALSEARKLHAAIENLIYEPSVESLEVAREAWIAVRIPYLQSEVFRFYEGPIDNENGPEGRLNAWPLDEAYIDYVEGSAHSGIINNTKDYPEISSGLLLNLHEKDGEKNISTGFHAIEFLLWGQDMNQKGPGNRPVEDFTAHPNADRRKAYLMAITELLVGHLEYLVNSWETGVSNNYRDFFTSGDPTDSIRKIFTGLGMMSGFEMSSERLMTAYDVKEQEEEHSCFSDTTHLDIEYDLLGIRNVWLGEYRRLDGTLVKGVGVKDLVASADAGLAMELDAAIQQSYELGKAIPAPFDQAILGEDGSASREAIWNAIRSLESQAGLIARAGKLFEIEIPISE